jgi:hypothetical protein
VLGANEENSPFNLQLIDSFYKKNLVQQLHKYEKCYMGVVKKKKDIQRQVEIVDLEAKKPAAFSSRSKTPPGFSTRIQRWPESALFFSLNSRK